MSGRPARVRSAIDVTVSDTSDSLSGGAARALAHWLEAQAPRSARGTVAVALVSDGAMRRLNRRFRGVDRPTDVLSFPAETAPARSPRRPGHVAGGPGGRVPRLARSPRSASHLGDIAIARGVATRQARSMGHTFGTELRILALHGLLHLLGYDHEQDRGEMGKVEERMRRRAGLPAGLITRGAQGAVDR